MRKLPYVLQMNYFHFQGYTKENSRSKKNVVQKASNCTCFTCTWLWDLLQVISDLFTVCPLFLVMHIQYLKVLSKDMKHLYAYNIQFGEGLNFGAKHTILTLTIGQKSLLQPVSFNF